MPPKRRIIMKLKNIKLVFFSPTGTSKKTVQGIAKGMKVDNIELIDLTMPENDAVKIEFSDTDFVIFGTPVYGGRVPVQAAERLAGIKGNNTLAASIVVYGNREYEDALLELKNIGVDSGFLPVAAGAFIGEHSFSIKEFPIAQGRPNKEDISEAEKFGKSIIDKIEQISNIDNIKPIDVPGNFPYKEGVAPSKAAASTDNDACTMCETCATVCPTGAITYEDEVVTDKDRCILCCACVRVCPTEARELSLPPILEKTKWLYENYSKPKKAELFI
jgi:ferredoxin